MEQKKTKMSWATVIVFAVLSAVAVAVLKLIPALENTSFQDPAVYPEFWMLFGILIAVNCEKWWEASLKVVVFFLISQPLIYLIQVPFSPLGFGLFSYYKYWFIITLLTIPAGAAAFFLPKKNWIGTVTMIGGLGLCAAMAAIYFWEVVTSFPHHILSLVFCIGLAIWLLIRYADKKSIRIVGTVIAAAVFVIMAITQRPILGTTLELNEGDWDCTLVEDPSIVEVAEDEENVFTVKAVENGTTFLTFTDEEGNVTEYVATVTNKGVYLSPFE